MFDSEILESAAAERADTEPKKRNCGRTGPTSPEGRAASSKNAIKHGACAQTLILSHETEEAWQLVLAHFCEIYHPPEDSLAYDFVRRTAQAEWHRVRTQRNFDCVMASTESGCTFNWTPDQIKQHDLALRYKNSAERAFQREFRLLEQFYKAHCPKPAKEPAASEEKEEEEEPNGGRGPTFIFTVEDPTSPTGQRELQRCVPQPSSKGPLRVWNPSRKNGP